MVQLIDHAAVSTGRMQGPVHAASHSLRSKLHAWIHRPCSQAPCAEQGMHCKDGPSSVLACAM